MDEANDNDLGWDLVDKEDGIWLVFNNGNEAINLGAERPVGNRFCDWLAERDFGE